MQWININDVKPTLGEYVLFIPPGESQRTVGVYLTDRAFLTVISLRSDIIDGVQFWAPLPIKSIEKFPLKKYKVWGSLELHFHFHDCIVEATDELRAIDEAIQETIDYANETNNHTIVEEVSAGCHTE